MDEKKEPTLLQQRKKDLFFAPTNGYDRLAPGEEEDIQAYCAGYKTFLDEGKTERECVDYAIATHRIDPARPGFQALAELGVVSPLRRAGMAKDDVRAASRELGLFTADKPSFSCIAVHVGAGRPVTAQALAETAERLGVTGGKRP